MSASVILNRTRINCIGWILAVEHRITFPLTFETSSA